MTLDIIAAVFKYPCYTFPWGYGETITGSFQLPSSLVSDCIWDPYNRITRQDIAIFSSHFQSFDDLLF